MNISNRTWSIGVIAALAGFALPTSVAASVGSYQYQGKPMECAEFQSSCVNKVANPKSFVASFTLPQDFNKTYNGDQTLFAFAYGFHFITDWSISDGSYTIGSATGDTLDPNSWLTYNNGNIRTWTIAATDKTGSIHFNLAPHLDYAIVNGNVLELGRSTGTWTTGGGDAPAGSTVPEPASWAMMLGGFGLMGAVVRYRRRSVATTFA